MTKTLKFKITGMHCASCSNLIKMALEDIKEIKKIDISDKTGSLSIDFDEKAVDEKTMAKNIINIVKTEGYKIIGD